MAIKSRRVRKGRRANTRKGGLFTKVYSPVHEVLTLAGTAVGAVTNTTRNVLQRGIKGVNNIGSATTSGANRTIRGLVSRKRRATRRANRR
jgi:hypothetical protein